MNFFYFCKRKVKKNCLLTISEEKRFRISFFHIFISNGRNELNEKKNFQKLGYQKLFF
jgi:hypothetical protein